MAVHHAEAPLQVETKDKTKSYQEILSDQLTEARGEINRSTSGVLLSGLSGGLDLSLSVLLMATMITLVGDVFSKPIREIMVANMYSIGFIFVVLGRSLLFTEQTSLGVLPVLNRRASVWQLLRLWGLVYVANLAGGLIFARLVTFVGPALGVTTPEAFGELAHNLVKHEWWVILASAVFAGWMMGLLGWLVTAGRDTVSQVLLVWLVTTAIGLTHLHHVVVGSTEVLAGIFAGHGATWADYFRFLPWATLGNIIGGTFFVALIKYSHVIRGSQEPDPVNV
jgi:formate/nitrite transporter FocA (FNT family)